jgi:hypothetical protein
MPGVVRPVSYADPPGRAGDGLAPSADAGVVGHGYHEESLRLMSGDQAVDPLEVPVAALADAAAPTAFATSGAEDESTDDKADAGEGEQPAVDGEEGDPRRATVLNRATALLGTTRGKWIAAGVGAAVLVLIALSVVLAIRSNKASTAEVSPVSEDSSATTSSGPPPSYPAAPDPGLGPNQPALNTPAPLPPDSLGGAGAAPDPWVGSSSQAVPNTSLPPGQTPADLSAPGAAAVPPPGATPPDPDAYDPELDGPQPIGPGQTAGTTPPDQTGLAGPTARPNDSTATPRNAGPLGSLDSITKPESPESSGRGESGSSGQKKTFGDGLSGLGHGL